MAKLIFNCTLSKTYLYQYLGILISLSVVSSSFTPLSTPLFPSSSPLLLSLQNISCRIEIILLDSLYKENVLRYRPSTKTWSTEMRRCRTWSSGRARPFSPPSRWCLPALAHPSANQQQGYPASRGVRHAGRQERPARWRVAHAVSFPSSRAQWTTSACYCLHCWAIHADWQRCARAGVQCRMLCVQYNQARRANYWRMACKLPIKDYNHGRIKL